MKTLTLLLLLLPCFAAAEQLAPQKEIAALIEFVRNSPCHFNRNGSWYASGEAVGHINSKYHAAFDKGLVHSAEDFIHYAASTSSFTGTPYKVQCAGRAERTCADWLTAELQRLRERNN